MTNVFNNSKYKDPKLAVDIGLLCWDGEYLRILLMARGDAPEVGGDWALPGTIVRYDETTDDAAKRALETKTKLNQFYLEQLETFSDVDRDPRGRVVSVAYFALTSFEKLEQDTKAHEDLFLAFIIPTESDVVRERPTDKQKLVLAFDHQKIIKKIFLRLRGKINYTSIALSLLPELFTLREVQQVYEAILSTTFAKPAFRRKLLDRKIIQPTGKMESGSAFRPAELYKRL